MGERWEFVMGKVEKCSFLRIPVQGIVRCESQVLRHPGLGVVNNPYKLTIVSLTIVSLTIVSTNNRKD